MNMYRARLKCLSGLSTPIIGDTLFGHVCWGIARNEGEKALKSFFEEFNGEIPLALSNGFPRGMLPAPVLKPKQIHNTDLNTYQDQKRAKKITFIPAEWIFDGPRPEGAIPVPSGGIEEVERMHNIVNRISGTTGEDSLYSLKELWPYEIHKGDKIRSVSMDIYIASSYTEGRIEELLRWSLENGYGADRSTGKGYMEIDTIETIDVPDNGNRSMALGPFVPSGKESLQDLRYDLFTRFGKLGGDYLLSSNPFKKPVVMYAAGTTFKEIDKMAVGTLLEGVHADSRVRHGAVTPVIRFMDSSEDESI